MVQQFPRLPVHFGHGSHRATDQDLKAETLRLGFDLVAVTRADPPPHAAALDGWLAAGNAGEMAYLARNAAKRKQPDLVVTDARSIVVVGTALSCCRARSSHLERSRHGQISRYAWGDDYHEVLEPRLRLLQSWLEQRVGRAQIGRSYVDTGPILERPVAVAAGLGFQGKNTLLIHPQQGSWFFLGEIVVDCELAYDEQTRTRRLRHVYTLPGGLSNPGVCRSLCARRPALYLLSDDRTQGPDPA